MTDDDDRPLRPFETHEITFDAPDWLLAGTLFEGDGPGPAILLSAAAMVPHGYYAPFARHLVESGACAVLTYDYRGVAASAGDRADWPDLRMKDWAVLDFPAALAALEAACPGREIVGMGHSYGGQALGLSGVADRFSRYATVATMSGYWRGLDTPWQVFVRTQFVGRAVATVLGRVPKAISPGEEMPGRIFLDWARWIGDPDYFFNDPNVPETERFADVTLPFLSVGLSDDVWGTPRAIGAFMRHYVNADLRKLTLSPGASGRVGHLGFFRPRHADTHWPAVTRFLMEGVWPNGAERQTRAPAS